MTELTFIPLGVGDAFSTQYYSSCILVKSGDFSLLIDCPHPIRKMLYENTSSSTPLDIKDINGVILTHLHADHCCGLEGFAFFSKYALQQKVPLFAHPDVSAELWRGHLAASMEKTYDAKGQLLKTRTQDDYFDLTPLSQTAPTKIGPFSIECRKTIHHIPTTALRLSINGRSLGYSADTSFDPSLIQWLSSCNLFIHETNTGTHTPYEKLISLNEDIKRKMNLIHYPDDFDIQNSEIPVLIQGTQYTV